MKNIKADQSLEYYINMEYPVLIYRADEGGFVAEIRELPGCLAQGETLGETYEEIEQVRKAWIEVAYEDGVEIPLPRIEQEYSGRFLARIPKSLHRRLVEQSSEDGISLNQYVTAILSGAVSEKEASLRGRELIQEMERIVDKMNATPYFFRPAVRNPFEIDVPVYPQSHEDFVNQELRNVAA